jgi:hypothetical protein
VPLLPDREFENMMSFMWEWQTAKQAYGLG